MEVRNKGIENRLDNSSSQRPSFADLAGLQILLAVLAAIGVFSFIDIFSFFASMGAILI